MQSCRLLWFLGSDERSIFWVIYFPTNWERLRAPESSKSRALEVLKMRSVVFWFVLVRFQVVCFVDGTENDKKMLWSIGSHLFWTTRCSKGWHPQLIVESLSRFFLMETYGLPARNLKLANMTNCNLPYNLLDNKHISWQVLSDEQMSNGW